MRTTQNYMTAIRCDHPGCKHEPFRTASFPTVARKQMVGAGWLRIKLNQWQDWQNLGLGSRGSKEFDCCPECKPKPRMTGAVV